MVRGTQKKLVSLAEDRMVLISDFTDHLFSVAFLGHLLAGRVLLWLKHPFFLVTVKKIELQESWYRQSHAMCLWKKKEPKKTQRAPKSSRAQQYLLL